MAGRPGLADAGAVTVIADGAKWIWGPAAVHLSGASGVRDIDHATEHLWAAGRAVLGDGTDACRAWVEGRRGTLLRSGAAGLLAEMGRAEWSPWRGYFEPHVNPTGYAARLAAGQSIGSGRVEGACKQVIGRRLKQTGARWKVRRVERLATLCAVQASDQWDDYWASKA